MAIPRPKNGAKTFMSCDAMIFYLNHLNRANLTQEHFHNLKSGDGREGVDYYSSKSERQLKKMLGEDIVNRVYGQLLLETNFMVKETDIFKKCLRWIARGLNEDLAILKALVDNEKYGNHYKMKKNDKGYYWDAVAELKIK